MLQKNSTKEFRECQKLVGIMVLCGTVVVNTELYVVVKPHRTVHQKEGIFFFFKLNPDVIVFFNTLFILFIYL